MVPDVGLERRDVEVADQDRAPRRVAARAEPVGQRRQHLELVAELRVELRVGQVAAGRDVEIVQLDPARQQRPQMPAVGLVAPVERASRPRAAAWRGSRRRDSPPGRAGCGAGSRAPRRSASGNSSFLTLISCRQSTSGATSRASRASPSSRSRTELTFQVVMRRGKRSGGLCRVLPRIDQRAHPERLGEVGLDCASPAPGHGVTSKVVAGVAGSSQSSGGWCRSQRARRSACRQLNGSDPPGENRPITAVDRYSERLGRRRTPTAP